MNAGEVATFRSGTGDAFVVRTQDVDHPIYVAAYMTGADGDGREAKNYGGRGDAEFVNVVPTGQYLNSYSFYADPTYAETSLVIVRAKARGEFKDAGSSVLANWTAFKPIGTRGEYEYVRVNLSREHGSGDKFDAGVCQYGVQRMPARGPSPRRSGGGTNTPATPIPGDGPAKARRKTARARELIR